MPILWAGSKRPPGRAKRRAILSSKAGVKADFGRVSHLRPGLKRKGKIKTRVTSQCGLYIKYFPDLRIRNYSELFGNVQDPLKLNLGDKISQKEGVLPKTQAGLGRRMPAQH